KLVGDGAMACIKCHTFNGQKAEGVQGIDMSKMTQRVKRDWFHHYLLDPQKLRPGTRMPTSFPNGKSFFPEVLDGTAAQQIGAGFEGPLGDNVVKLPTGPTFALLEKADSAWPASGRKDGQKFKGYRLTKDDRPTFLYAVGDVTIEDFPNPVVEGKQEGLKRTFTLKAEKAPEDLYLRAAAGKEVTQQKDGWYKVVQKDGSTYRLKLTGKGKAAVRKAGDGDEL